MLPLWRPEQRAAEMRLEDGLGGIYQGWTHSISTITPVPKDASGCYPQPLKAAKNSYLHVFGTTLVRMLRVVKN